MTPPAGTRYSASVTRTPLSRRPRLPRGMARVQWLFGGWSAVVLLFLYVPIAVLILWSFNTAAYSGQWEGFTTKWYSALWHRTVLQARDAIDPADVGWRHFTRAALDSAGAADADVIRKTFKTSVERKIWDSIPLFIEGMKNSLIVGVVSTAASVLLGTVAAWLTFKYKFPLHRTLATVIAVPIVIPEIIMGVSLLAMFTVVGTLLAKIGFSLEHFMLPVILAHVTFSFPYVMVTIQARLAGLDPALEEAAMDLGATPRQAFLKVVVPYLMPAIVGGMLMAFTLSLDDFTVTYFVKDPASLTLPIRIYDARRGPAPMVHVVSSVMVGVTVLMVVASEGVKRLSRR